MRRALPFLALLFFVALADCRPAENPPVSTAHPDPPARFQRDQGEGVASNPHGVIFEINLPSGGRYRMGERIPVVLRFASSVPNKFRLDGGLYDRSGRLDLDVYRLSPHEGVVDPVKDYFEWHGGFGGIRQMPILSDKPHEMTFDINEWVRFERPGTYSLYVRSNRLEHEDAGKAVQSAATSNLLTVEIVAADAAWEEETRKAGVEAIDGAANDEQRYAGARLLRFLGTDKACEDMARRIRGTSSDFQLELGLVGARNRGAAIAALEARIKEADFPVTQGFVDTLALLRAKKLDPRPDPQMVRRRVSQSVIAGEVAAALGTKDPQARATTLNTLMEIAWSSGQSVMPSWFVQLEPEIGPLLAKLPPDVAQRLLEYRWRRFAGPAVLPVLKTLVDDPATQPELRRAALQRIAELDAPDFRARVKDAIRSAKPPLGFSAFKVLGSLPDATLPEMDDVLATRVETCAPPSMNAECTYPGFILALQLAARYATPAVAPRIKAVLAAKNEFGDDAGAPLLAYFLRVDPPFGRSFAEAALATARKKKPGPFSLRMFEDASAIFMSRELEVVLLDALRDPSSEIAAGAAETLGRRGSAATEKPLWDRLEAWHARWEGREDELRYRVTQAENPNQGELRLESALARALSQGTAWLADAGKLRRLASLLVTSNEKQNAVSAARNWQTRVPVSFLRTDGGEVAMAQIAQCEVGSIAAAKEKLAQFPAGTTFAWSGEATADYEELRRFAEAHAMTIAR